jgi:predicted aspartyl protease
MRVALFVTTLVLVLIACSAPQHGAVSASSQRKLAALTLTQDEGKELLYGPKSLRLGVSGEGTFRIPFTLQNRRPHVRVSVNGAGPQSFLFDTGASLSAIEARTAIQHRLPLFDSSQVPAKARGIGGEEAMRFSFATLGIGEFTLQNVPLFVRTHQNEVRILGPMLKESLHTDILGFNPLAVFVKYITIDYPRRSISFSTTDRYQPAASARRARLKVRNLLPYVTLRIGEVTWEALLDTGSSFGVEVSRDVAAQLGILEKAMPVVGGVHYGIGGSVDTTVQDIRHAVVPRLDGLGAPFQNVGVGIRPNLSLIGSFFLQHFRVTLDLDRGMLYLER